MTGLCVRLRTPRSGTERIYTPVYRSSQDYLVSQNIVSQRNGKISREAYAVVDNFLEELGAHVKWLPIKGQVRGQAMKAQAQALPGHKHVGPKAGDKVRCWLAALLDIDV